MSGPYCKHCLHWYKGVRSENGECRDKSKRIYTKHGSSKNDCPVVHETDTCSNWKPSDSSTEEFGDWIDYLKESGNFESYDGMCDCYACREIRKGYLEWKK